MSELSKALNVLMSMEVEKTKRVNPLQEAIEIIQWFIDNDETNEGDMPLPEHGGQTWDELNAYWIEGKRRAERFVKENS